MAKKKNTDEQRQAGFTIYDNILNMKQNFGVFLALLHWLLISVLPPGMEPWGPGSAAPRPNLWIAKESPKAGFLILGTTDLSHWIFLCCGGLSCALKNVSNIPILY